MRRIILIIIITTFLLLTAQVQAAEPEIEGKAAVLMDQATGRVLWSYNPHEPLPPASTTKVMTLLLALELGQPEDVATVSQLAQSQTGSRVYLTAGEQYTLRELLYAVQLSSANDAAVVVAEHIAGSVEGFVQLMNERARELGARNTNFVNPHGLPDPEHRASAYDLALIARAALEIPKFKEIITTDSYPISWPGREEDRQLYNKNRLFQLYEGADGVKTGYTTEAGYTFIGSATRNGQQLIAVVLGSTDSGIWSDTIALLDYGFANFSPYQLASKGEELTTLPVRYGDDVPVILAEGFNYILTPEEKKRVVRESQLPDMLVAPVAAGEVLGTLTISLAGEELARLPLVVATEVKRKIYTHWWFWLLVIYSPWRIRVAIRRLRRHRRRKKSMLSGHPPIK
jgi:D-alanyl-D-alanine carboxypeptidase (penicillin-binding protein 5/6)